ncbi:site-specific integrase, partial [Tepidiforma sp.]|uniref:site-specific integrase n=1 Tax=Tepidiforma sp. TaxID=2682230 RepID=UPI00258CA926
GSIQKRGDRTWRISIELDRDPQTGRRRRRWETFHGTKREAEARLAQLIHEFETGLAVEPSRLTVADWLRQWLEQRRPHLRETTFERYRASAEGRLIPALGRLPLQQLKPIHVQQAYARWQDEGLAPATIASHHRVLGKALKDALRLQLIGRIVTQAVEVPSAHSRTIDLTTIDLQGLIRSLDEAEQPWRTAILLIAYTGMRRSEALGLEWQDIDLDRFPDAGVGTASIRQARTRTAAGAILVREPKTRAGVRQVPLLPPVVQALREWRTRQLAHRLASGADWQAGDFVFSVGPAPMRPDSLTVWWTRHARRHGLTIRLHDLRHLAATLMAQYGVPPRVIAQVLGHARASFTLDVYAGKPDFAVLVDAVQALGRAYRDAREHSHRPNP